MRRPIDFIKDVFCVEYRAYRILPTKLGFDLYMGKAIEQPSDHEYWWPSFILTHELVGHLESVRDAPARHGLPVSAATVKRLRRRLGHNKYKDFERWWLDRIEDLINLNMNECADKHGVHWWQVEFARLRYVGRVQRDAFWYFEDEPAKDFIGDKSYRNIALKYSIADSTAKHLRTIVRRHFLGPQPHGKPKIR